jgi:putative ABC transport system permease protein
VLFLVTAVAIVSRVLALAARPLRAASRAWPIAGYVGAHRISRYKVAVLGLLAASAISTGVVGYSTTFDQSLEATLTAKTLTFIGSDTAARLLRGEQTPPIPLPVTPLHVTTVGLHRDVWLDLDRDGGQDNVRLLEIDPATFASAAFWDPTYSATSLGDIVSRLAEPSDDGRIPAVIVDSPVDVSIEQLRGAGVPGAVVEQADHPFTLEPIADVSAFPGMNRVEPTVIVAAGSLDGIGVRSDAQELWIRGDPDVAVAALEDSGVRFALIRDPDAIADRATFLTASWTFGFMEAMGWAAVVLVIAGIAVYLDARRRARVLGYSFVRRMGLTRAQHRRALFIEIAASVVVGCWVGLVTSLVGAWLALQLVDPVPSYAPPTLWRVAWPTIAGLAIAAVLTAASAAVVAQRRTDRDNPLEVLRGGL